VAGCRHAAGGRRRPALRGGGYGRELKALAERMGGRKTVVGGDWRAIPRQLVDLLIGKYLLHLVQVGERLADERIAGREHR